MKKQMFALMLGAAFFTTTAASAMDSPPIEDSPPISPRALRVASTDPAQNQQPTLPIQASRPCLIQDFTTLEDVNKKIVSFVLDGSDLVHLALTCPYFHNVLNEIIQKKVFIIGNTWSGKSTLVHLLMEKPLVAEKRKYIDENEDEYEDLCLTATEKIPNVDIVRGITAGTLKPNAAVDYTNKRLIIDCPGFDEPRGKNQDYINAQELYKLLKGKVSVVLLVQKYTLRESRGSSFACLLNKLTEIFPDQAQLKNLLSLVVSCAKSEDCSPVLKCCAKSRPSYLTDRGYDLLSFFRSNPSHHASFASPSQKGPYNMSETLKMCMSNLRYVDNPQVTPPLWDSIMSKEGRWSSKGTYNFDGTQQ